MTAAIWWCHQLQGNFLPHKVLPKVYYIYGKAGCDAECRAGDCWRFGPNLLTISGCLSPLVTSSVTQWQNPHLSTWRWTATFITTAPVCNRVPSKSSVGERGKPKTVTTLPLCCPFWQSDDRNSWPDPSVRGMSIDWRQCEIYSLRKHWNLTEHAHRPSPHAVDSQRMVALHLTWHK